MTEHPVAAKITREYQKMFPLCLERHERLLKFIPGGATRSLSYFKPWPIHISHGRGAHVYTHEGHTLFDVTNAYGALIHGHGDPDVALAVSDGIENGSQYSTPTDGQYKLARLLCERVPGFQRLRFLNSGTEATMFALRAARAFTGRDKILKMTGGFHGTHDCVAASTKKGVITAGIPRAMTRDILEVPFNDRDALEKAVEQNAKELAAVIMEPFLGAGGVILPHEGYLEAARQVTKDHGVLLIFDEIFSFRVDMGGCQSLFNIIPDITTVGKVVGGGLPIGVLGGREDIMNIFCHEKTKTPLYHSGTFNGYETVMQAGFAAMAKFDSKAVARVNSFGDRFQLGLKDIFKSKGLNIQITGIGSLANIHFVNQPVTTPEQVLESEEELHALMHLSLLNKGVFSIPRGLFILSTAMTQGQIDDLVEKIGNVLEELLPLVRDKYPHLLL